MEIRGLGIINIKDLYGISAVREAKVIDLIIELEDWDATAEYDRLGFDDETEKLLDVEVTKVRLPVRPGRNIATLIEVAARNQLLKHQGIHSARAFRDKLHRAMTDTDGVDAVE
jgi:HPr kinase/phosphorylase